MSTDATRIADITQYGSILWSGVFQMTLAFISLYQLIGWQMFIGVGIMVLSFPINAMIARVQTRMQKTQMKNKDQRTRLMNEILNNIRSIKLYAWENAFAQRLFGIRNDKELAMLRKMGYLQSFSTFTWNLIRKIYCPLGTMSPLTVPLQPSWSHSRLSLSTSSPQRSP